MRFSNHEAYLKIKEWFLTELLNIRKEFYILLKKVAKKYGISPQDILLLLREEKTWPHLSSDLYRALTLVQEIILWSRVPTIQNQKYDMSNIDSIVTELAMNLHLNIFSKMEKRFEKLVEKLSISRRESFLDIMEIFERGLSQDRFSKKDIVLGIIASQWKGLSL